MKYIVIGPALVCTLHQAALYQQSFLYVRHVVITSDITSLLLSSLWLILVLCSSCWVLPAVAALHVA